MFTTTQPIILAPANGSAPAVLADKAFLCLSPWAPVISGGRLSSTCLFRAQRVHVGVDGTITPNGQTLDKPFTAASLAALRAANPTVDGLLTQIEGALDQLGPLLGL